LTELEYASWVMDYIFDCKYEMQFLSPFSSNPSTMALNPSASKTLADRNTLFEIEVLKIIRDT
jgi:hypothetical protein